MKDLKDQDLAIERIAPPIITLNMETYEQTILLFLVAIEKLLSENVFFVF